MSFFQAILLGIIQGLTEFLPVSSSAHLALIPYWLNWNLSEEYVFLFGVLVQMGTLLAVIVYFWKDILTILKAFFTGIVKKQPFADPEAKLGWMIIIASIPAAFAGVLIKDVVESAFNSPRAIAIFLLCTAGLLFLAEKMPSKNRTLRDLTWLDALLIGIFQAFALFPGISRSGATISGGLFRKFNRGDASRFAFLISIPIMIGAGLFSVFDMPDLTSLTTVLPALILATIVAAIVGYFSIRWMLAYIRSKPFTIFSVYCAVIGTVTLILTFVR